jgi:hypothetical protein
MEGIVSRRRGASKPVISADGSGPEGRNIIGNLTEEEITAFCESVLGWRVLFRNIDARIPHTLPLGLFEEKERGIDLLCAAANPFLNCREGVVVETKHVGEGTTLRHGRLTEWIATLKEKIEGIRSSRLQKDADVVDNIDGAVSLGLLVVRFRQYDKEEFWEEVGKVELSRYRGAGLPIVLLLSNDRLSPLVEFRRRVTGRAKFEYYYPSYLANDAPKFAQSLAPQYLFSDVIFGRLASLRRPDESSTFVLMFEEPQPEALRVLGQMLEQFRSSEFEQIDRFFFARGDYTDVHLYRERLENAGLGRVSSEQLVVLPQNFDIPYDISKELNL